MEFRREVKCATGISELTVLTCLVLYFQEQRVWLEADDYAVS